MGETILKRPVSLLEDNGKGVRKLLTQELFVYGISVWVWREW
jgi:hypothetical protein